MCTVDNVDNLYSNCVSAACTLSLLLSYVNCSMYVCMDIHVKDAMLQYLGHYGLYVQLSPSNDLFSIVHPFSVYVCTCIGNCVCIPV